MDLILTHEQADFDAVGALLGASLLQKSSLPVLPRRVNRNVRSFLNLYAPKLPFVDFSDLPLENITSILLVDTQSLITLKGVTKKTRISVIDHHAMRGDIQPGWSMECAATGASTTLIVEKLIELNVSPNPIHATMMLLGIHEDTGSMTYSSTTTRDVRAAAFLMDHGADLAAVSNFLNPPLSLEQMRLYNDLLIHAVNHDIHGHSVTIAIAEATWMKDEISSVAHKLRDLVEPEGLFLIVRTSEGIRLVARSTSNHVNVARILAHFKGGGHERAASALVQQVNKEADSRDDLTAIQDQLLSILGSEIQPAVIASQIMSSEPHVISPDTITSSALKKMQRLGYEGFPVVKGKRILGLLTRRSVDRAHLHNLDLPATSLMDAGEVFVHTDDTVETVQRKMSDSGWGQIPVIDKPSGKIIGIVTRTDILKMIAPHHNVKKIDWAGQLEASLAPARLALLNVISDSATSLSMPVYIVGGFVRDLVLKMPVSDFDIVVEGDAIRLASDLSKKYSGSVVSHHRFGTAKWHIAARREEIAHLISPQGQISSLDLPDSLDLVSARSEYYDHPTALPTVERSSIKYDLHRRDFTINTLALRLDDPHRGELYDFWGGMADIEKGLIRVLHPLSFVEDPTRILRAIRFEQRFQFHIEPRTLELLNEARVMLRQVSGSRLRHELDLTMIEPSPSKILQRASDLGVLEHIHKELAWDPTWVESLETMLSANLPKEWKLPEHLGALPLKTIFAYLLWLGHFPRDTASRIANHLRFTSQMLIALQVVSTFREKIDSLASLPPSQFSKQMEKVPLISLPVLYFLSDQPSTREKTNLYLSTWRSLKIYTRGEDLQQAGIPVGPRYKEIISQLRSAWLDGKVKSKVEEFELRDRLIKST